MAHKMPTPTIEHNPKLSNKWYSPKIITVGAPKAAKIQVKSMSLKSIEIKLKNYPLDTSVILVKVVD